MSKQDPSLLVDVPAWVVGGVAACGWRGVALPRTRVSGFVVYPVVEIDQQVWVQRVEGGQPPGLDRSTLVLWESWTPELGVMPPASPISIVGFVSTPERPADALSALDSLAGYGAGLWLPRGPRGPSRWSLSEFDVVGVSVVWADADRHELLVAGRDGPVATARRMTATRYKEETLFSWALATGRGPGQ